MKSASAKRKVNTTGHKKAYNGSLSVPLFWTGPLDLAFGGCPLPPSLICRCGVLVHNAAGGLWPLLEFCLFVEIVVMYKTSIAPAGDGGNAFLGDVKVVPRALARL